MDLTQSTQAAQVNQAAQDANYTLYENLFQQVERMYGLKNDEHLNLTLDFAEKLRDEGKRSLSRRILELAEILYMEPFRISPAMFCDYMMPLDPLDIAKDIHQNTDNMDGFVASKGAENCGEYSHHVFKKFIDINTEYFKKHGELCFDACAMIGADFDHMFNVIVIGDMTIMVDHWYSNLICEFTAENLAKIGCLGGISNFRIVVLENPAKQEAEHQKRTGVRFPNNHNPFRISQRNTDLIERRLDEINREFRDNRNLQMIMLDRVNEDLDKICKYTTDNRDAKLYFTTRLIGNLHVITMINNYYSNIEDKSVPAHSLDEYGVVAMVASGAHNLTEVKGLMKQMLKRETNEEDIDKLFVLINIEAQVRAVGSAMTTLRTKLRENGNQRS